MQPGLMARIHRRVKDILADAVKDYESFESYYRFRYETTAVIVMPILCADTHVMVRIAALVLQGVAPHPNLWKRISEINNQYMIGKLCYWDSDQMLTFEHSLLGDDLSRDEFLSILNFITLTADALDERIQEEFGGKRFIECEVFFEEPQDPIK